MYLFERNIDLNSTVPEIGSKVEFEAEINMYAVNVNITQDAEVLDYSELSMVKLTSV